MDALLSFIIPFYKKLPWFTAVFPRNLCLHSESVEVVLVLDEPTQERGVVEFVRNQQAKVRVVVNDHDHPWRPPCAAINVGLRHALGEYVAVVSPESYVLVEPGYLEQRISTLPERFVLTGNLWHGVGIEPEHPIEVVQAYADTHDSVSDIYGFKCCAKELLVEVGGYDERRRGYGGDDDDVYNRLCAKGRRVVDPNIRIVHPYHNSVGRADTPREPYAPMLDFEPFGRQFSRIAFDYANVAQMAEQVPSKHQVAGSLPVVRSTL